jgi:hypothetical protein
VYFPLQVAAFKIHNFRLILIGDQATGPNLSTEEEETARFIGCISNPPVG